MRISDWSSDVCSSDLVARCQRQHETGNKQDLQYASRDVRGEVFHGAPLDGWLEVGTHASIRCHSACSALSTAAGTNAETSPPRREISRTSEDEMKPYCSAGVRNSVSTSGIRCRFMLASWNSYSKSDTARSPRSEEHTAALQSLMRSSYAGFCLK